MDGKGTSYSGGTGGGANDCRNSVINSEDGSDNGGIGGKSYASYSNGHGCTGGAGNPGGDYYVWYRCDWRI